MQLNVTDRNLLLRAASSAKRPRLDRKLKHVMFEAGQQIWPADVNIPYALFPLRGVISLQMSPHTEKPVEIAVVGREGQCGGHGRIIRTMRTGRGAFGAARAFPIRERYLLGTSVPL